MISATLHNHLLGDSSQFITIHLNHKKCLYHHSMGMLDLKTHKLMRFDIKALSGCQNVSHQAFFRKSKRGIKPLSGSQNVWLQAFTREFKGRLDAKMHQNLFKGLT